MRFLVLILTACFLLPTILSAQSVDILSQGEGYVSPFYKGRALWSKESRLTLLAVPQGLGSPALLNYRWSRNGTVLGTISGIGKNSLSFTDTVFSKPVTILIEIVDVDNNVLAKSTTTLAPISPFLAVYENNPLYGFMFHRNVSGAYRMEGEEITFTAFPYLFNALRRETAALLYKWNGVSGGGSITYRTPEEGSGTAEVAVSLTHAEALMQSAQKSFLVDFGSDEN
jgi:hypothetical protein